MFGLAGSLIAFGAVIVLAVFLVFGQSDRDVFTIEYTDPGTPFGRPKPKIRVVMTADKFVETLSKAHVGFLIKAISDPYPHDI